MRYDEVRVQLTAQPKGGFWTQVSSAGACWTRGRFVPPSGVNGAALYKEWFDSLSRGTSQESKREREDRRRKAGTQLFKALFASAAGRVTNHLNVLEDRFRAGNGRRQGLRLRLILGNALTKGTESADAILPVSNLPHELIVPEGRPHFLARSSLVSIVRTIGVAEQPPPLLVSGNLRVLVVAVQPSNAAPLDWVKEADRIQRALSARTDTAVELLKNASFECTMQRLTSGGFHILHFIGHGGYDPKSGGYLLFEDMSAPQPVLAEKIADGLSRIQTLRLAVLNACHSGELPSDAGGDPLASIAAALSVYGVPAVIGMQVAVTDSAAIAFASAFYGALREGESIETAVADGRLAIDLDSPEWATPVLYLRGEASDLFDFGVQRQGPITRSSGPPELALGIRTLVGSEKFHLADWAKRLETTVDRLLPLEEFFQGRFISSPGLWAGRVLPRLNRFLAEAVEQERALKLSLAAHGTVAFAAGYYFTKSATKVTLVQVTSGETLFWSEREGEIPKGHIWQDFEENTLNPGAPDVAVAVEITQNTSRAASTYVAERGTSVGRLVTARIAGQPGKTRVQSGAHAHRLASDLHQWLKDHTGNHSQRRLHLFISAPNAFLFFLGQLARNLGPVRLYEYDFEGTRHGTYEPSLDLPADSPAFFVR